MKELLFEIQKKLLTFHKDGSNPFYKSSYLTLDNLLDKLLPICNETGILIYHKTQDNMVKTVVTTPKWDEEVVSSFPLGSLNDPQKIGSYITYAKRYNLSQIFNIVTDDDDDGNNAIARKQNKKAKPSFTEKNLKNLLEKKEQWDWDKNLEDTLAFIKQKYSLSSTVESDIVWHFNKKQ